MTHVPLTDSVWLMLAFYVIHIIDESLLGGSFVEKVKQHWWPQYSWWKFFWFNAGYLSVMFVSIVLYDRCGKAFLFLPLAWAVERFVNSLWHVWWTIRFREYSPGLLTSVLIWMETYFIAVARSPRGVGSLSGWPLAVPLGMAAATFMMLHFPSSKRRRTNQKQHSFYVECKTARSLVSSIKMVLSSSRFSL